MTEIQKTLFALQDVSYGDFHSRLMPGTDRDKIIGVRTPDLRSLAKKLWKEGKATAFMEELPHRYYEENNLHACFICLIKDYDTCIYETERFLPYIDNWATCDGLTPKVLAENMPALEAKAFKWMQSEHTYTVRFGMGVLMRHFLREDFKAEHLYTVASVKTREYYIKMMQAWYFATALAFQYDEALKAVKSGVLEKQTHNKAIQKATESYRITEKQKAELRLLKR